MFIILCLSEMSSPSLFSTFHLLELKVSIIFVERDICTVLCSARGVQMPGRFTQTLAKTLSGSSNRCKQPDSQALAPIHSWDSLWMLFENKTTLIPWDIAPMLPGIE